jgi:3-hydroxyisobutyrate dehydrogenase-like beta-hydroxyacid dehydrogenase
MIVGLLHPGEMGAAVGGCLTGAGHEMLWASEGRSHASAERALSAGLRDVACVDALAARAEVILSICPPSAAEEVARAVGPGFEGLFVDANAIAPAHSRRLSGLVTRYVDGGIVGGPPSAIEHPRLYLSGSEGPAVAELFAGTWVDARVLGDQVGTASALKLAYAAWTKGTAAMLLAILAMARAEGVQDALLAEWAQSQPGPEARSPGAARSSVSKGARWIGEMHEIADTFAADDLPDGFHRAAAEVFQRTAAAEPGAEDDALERALAALRDQGL